MQAIEQLRLIAHGDQEQVAQIANVIVLVWNQYCQGAVDRQDWISILERNYNSLKSLEDHAVRDLALESIERLTREL